MKDTDHPPIGIDHVTVVPGNLDPSKRRFGGNRVDQGTTARGVEDSGAQTGEADERPADEQPTDE